MQRAPRRARFAPALAAAGRLLLPALALALGHLAPIAHAQGAHPPATATRAVREEGVRWQSLTPAQREALAPLERDWPTIEAQRKQKWLALAARFRTLPPEERARITERMVEWAKLTPAERGLARLRFEEARQVPAPDRSARWQAYQALPPEKRAQFAARAASAVATPTEPPAKVSRPSARDSKEAKSNLVTSPAHGQAPRPVAPTLVQAAPGATTTLITRRPSPPPHQQAGMPKIATTPEFVQRSTLLPKRGPQAAPIAPPGVAPPARSVIPPAPKPATSAAR